MEKIDNNEKEIINKITNTILKYYPKTEREEVLFGRIQPQMDIIIEFINEEGKDYTSIYFCKGTIYARNSLDVPERFLVNGLISPNTISELIFNLLEDYDYFRSISLIEDRISIELGLDLKYGVRYGIGCNRIGLNLEYYNHPNKEQIKDIYINEIIKIYRQEIDNSIAVNNEMKLKLKEMH